MFAIAFDLTVAAAEKYHPKGATQAYADVRRVMNQHGFAWTQGSLYTTKDEDLAKLFLALNALKKLSWFSKAVADIRAFRVEQWSDFTAFMKGTSIRRPAKVSARPKNKAVI